VVEWSAPSAELPSGCALEGVGDEGLGQSARIREGDAVREVHANCCRERTAGAVVVGGRDPRAVEDVGPLGGHENVGCVVGAGVTEVATLHEDVLSPEGAQGATNFLHVGH